MRSCSGRTNAELPWFRESWVRTLAGVIWPCLAVACTPTATSITSATARSATVLAQVARPHHSRVEPRHQPDPERSPADPEKQLVDLKPPVLLGPTERTVLQAQGHAVKVKFTWRVPRQKPKLRSFVEVLARKQDGTHEVFAAYVRGSEATISLPGSSARYVWRVYATAAGSEHYAPSMWGGFTVGGGNTVDQ